MRGREVLLTVALLTVALLAGRAETGTAQTMRPTAVRPHDDTVTRIAGKEYAASGFHRWLFGGHYRDLWTTPIRVPVLDLARFGGGLTPEKEGGGQQTKSLRFTAADGGKWAFRSVNKDPSKALPEELREGFVASAVKDQISASFPGGAVVTPPFYAAVGLLYVRPRLVVLPDDPRLGEFRKEYGGMLGMLEEYPDDGPDGRPGFAGATKILGTDELMARVNAGSEDRPDAREFLAARLIDLLLNNWDRHQGQWKWAQATDGDPVHWRPIPRDMDQVLFAIEGLLPGIARVGVPKFVALTPEIDVRGLTLNSMPLDRRLLAGLARADFDSVARRVAARVTDAVIDSALDRLPAAYHAKTGAELATLLRARRDALPAAAARWYAALAEVVDVHGTDAADRAEIVRVDDGTVRVRLADKRGRAYYDRRFLPDETHEIRVYLHGGGDRAVVRGAVEHSITVRVIGGNGTNTLIDSSRVDGDAHPTRVYDVGPTEGVSYGLPADAKGDTLLDRRPALPRGTREWRDATLILPDYGSAAAPAGALWFTSDLGLVIDAGARFRSYGFRRYPYARELALETGLASGAHDGRLAIGLDVRPEPGVLHWSVRGEMTGLELTRFYGVGNETVRALPNEQYELEHTVYRLQAGIGVALGDRGDLSLGPAVELHHTDTSHATFIGTAQPYGAGDFGTAGLRGTLSLDAHAPHEHGLRRTQLRGGGAWFPAVWDATQAYGELHGEVSTAIGAPVPLEPELALRAGGHKVWGAAPYFALAYLGGHEDLRGWDEQRFAGDGAAYGSAELRLRLFRIPGLPVRLGAVGLADAGRVWLAGETSDTWHTALGGGGFLEIPHFGTLSVLAADGAERTAVYVRGGFWF